jgi:hypothetical protein
MLLDEFGKPVEATSDHRKWVQGCTKRQRAPRVADTLRTAK